MTGKILNGEVDEDAARTVLTGIFTMVLLYRGSEKDPRGVVQQAAEAADEVIKLDRRNRDTHQEKPVDESAFRRSVAKHRPA